MLLTKISSRMVRLIETHVGCKENQTLMNNDVLYPRA